MENREQLLKLTSAVYKITGLLPEKEPLVFLIRQKAVEIMQGSILVYLSKRGSQAKMDVLTDIEVIKDYFELAKQQNWVSNVNFDILKTEYLRVKDQIEKVEIQERREKPAREQRISHTISAGQMKQKTENALNFNNLKERHKKIIKILQKRDSMQVKDFENIFPGVSKRTLRRDMSYLFDLGYVKRQGDANNTLYKILRVV